MEGAVEKIERLIAIGEGFTFQKAANLSERGYLASLRPEYISWTTRVRGAIGSIFKGNTAPASIIDKALVVPLIGNGDDKFDLSHSYYMGALASAADVLQEDTFNELQSEKASGPLSRSNRVFVVHGHDDNAKSELEIMLTEMGLEPIVLHRQADEGQTIIEKFETHSDVGFAFILLTPDEVAYVVGEEEKDDKDRKKEYRARPNVIFEFGFFVGKLGRSRTCCLYKSPTTRPTDVDGMIYKPFKNSIEEAGYAISKELKAAGYMLA